MKESMIIVNSLKCSNFIFANALFKKSRETTQRMKKMLVLSMTNFSLTGERQS